MTVFYLMFNSLCLHLNFLAQRILLLHSFSENIQLAGRHPNCCMLAYFQKSDSRVLLRGHHQMGINPAVHLGGAIVFPTHLWAC